MNTDDDRTRHAELNLMAAARRRFPPALIRECTVYTSTAPCMMCTAVLWDLDIGGVVFGVSYNAFHELRGQKFRGIPGDEIYRLTGKPLAWVGPVLEEEGLGVLRLWPPGDP